jgi:hypothetical protein
MRAPLPMLLVAALALPACEEAEPPPAAPVVASPGDGPPPGMGMLQPACDPDEPLDPGPTLPRRLNRFEYDNTVRDLFGEDLGLARDFLAEEESLGFDNNARALQVTPVHAEQFMSGAETLAARAGERMGALLPCDPAEIGDAACLRAFVSTFGERAWRRPLEADEVDRLVGLYDVAVDLGGDRPLRDAFEMVIEALLQSPHFLYRVEVGEPVPGRPDLRRLTDHELASRLSYLVWRSMPDDTLLAEADAGRLRYPEQLAAQARRMVEDPRARDGLWTFFEQWLEVEEVLHLDRDPRYYPDWTPEQGEALYEQARRFVDHVAWSPDADLRALFGAPYTFADGDLARTYGLSGAAGAAFQQTFPDDRLAGVLTLPAVMAATSKPNMTSPIHRGIFVRERLLCTPLPPPPADIVVVPPDPDPNLTTRETFTEHSSNVACKGCHQLIDPVGFGFEHFDAVGRWRDTENGRPVDSAATLIGTLDVDGDYGGAAEMGRALADSEHAHRCVTMQFFRFAYGRGETGVDACALDRLYAGYVESGYDFGALVAQLATDESFRFRRSGEAP